MLSKLLKEKNDTAYKLANATGISQGLLSDYKSGRSKPTIENIIKISKYFDVSADYLLGLTDNPVPTNKRTPAVLEKAEALKAAVTNILGHEPTENDLEKFKELAEVFFKKLDEKSK